MEDEEIIPAQQESTEDDYLKTAIKKAQKSKTIDPRNAVQDSIALARAKQNKFDGTELTIPTLRSSSATSIQKYGATQNREPERNFIREQADATVKTDKKVVDFDGSTVVDFDPKEFKDDSFLGGYNDILYVKPLSGTENGPRKAINNAVPFALPGLVSDVLERFDDDQVYEALVPSTVQNPETGNYLLRKVRGTRKQLAANQYNMLNQYGPKAEDENMFISGLKTGINTLNETDDLLISALKYGQDLAMLSNPSIGGMMMAGLKPRTALDEVYERTIKDTESKELVTSDSADEFGSANWFASGVGGAFGSLVQFGGVGRGIRGAVGLTDAGLQTLGKSAMKEATLGKISTWGSSGVVGFGYAYKEALQNGLNEPDALAYGSLVGLLNSAIEVKLGAKFDDYLTGGGPQKVSKDIIAELKKNGEKVGSKEIDGWLKRNGKSFVDNIPTKASNMGSEALEEFLQDNIEQGAKLAYNALIAEDGAKKMEGKFNIEEYSFTQSLAAGMFGAIAASPMGSHRKQMKDYILEGKSDQVTQSIDNSVLKGDLTSLQGDQLKKTQTEINQAIKLNGKVFEGLSGPTGYTLQKEVLNLLGMKKDLQKLKDKSISTLAEKTQAGDMSAAEKEKTNQETIQKAIDGLDGNLKKFEDTAYIKQRVDQLNKADSNVQNIFKFLSDKRQDQETDNTESEFVKRATDEKRDASLPLVRNVDEYNYALSAISSDKLPGVLLPQINKEASENGFFLSPKLDREKAIAAGVPISDLPLSKEEKEQALTNPEAFADRSISREKFDAIVNSVPENKADKRSNIERVLDEPSKFGLNQVQINSLDNLQDAIALLNPEQAKAITSVFEKGNPTTVILNDDANRKGRSGAFFRNSNSLNINNAQSAINKIKEAKSKNDLAKAQNELFMTLTHETGHSLFDKELGVMYKGWKRAMDAKSSGKTDALTPNDKIDYAYFDRIMKLANVAYSAFKSDPLSPRLYFHKTIAPAFHFDKNQQPTTPQFKTSTAALTYVKEFLAEVLSNDDFQRQLDLFNISDKDNQELLMESGYNYEVFESNNQSLLGQVWKAISGVFSRMGKVMTNGQMDSFGAVNRTLFKEAYGLLSNVGYNKFINRVDSQKPVKFGNKVQELSMSSFDMVNLFPNGNIEPDALAASVLKSLSENKINVRKEDQEQLIDNISKFVAKKILREDSDEILLGSMMVVYSKASNNFIISWQTTNDEGDVNHRSFFNRFGVEVFLNTDTTNFESRTTLVAPNAFVNFSTNSQSDQFKIESQAILNNIEKAKNEGYTGKTFLDLNENHSWQLNGQTITGEVQVMYSFQDGTRGVIGFVPDMAKVSISRLLSSGSNIVVTIDSQNKGRGSKGFVKRNAENQIVTALKTNTKEDTSEFKLEEGLFPALTFKYSPESSVDDKVLKLVQSADTITTDNKDVKLSLDPFESTDYFSDNISFYDPNPVVRDIPGTVKEKIQFLQDGLKLSLRAYLYFRPGYVIDTSINDLDGKIAQYREKVRSFINASLKDYPELADTLGFATQQEEADFIEAISKDVKNEFSLRNGTTRDNQDFSGMTSDPSGKISVAIKADLGLTNYTYEGKRYWITYEDIAEIMFEAASVSDNFPGMVKALKAIIDSRKLSRRDNAMATSVYNHLSKPRATAQEDEFFKSAHNSYWSQFGSYIRLNAVTVRKNDNGSVNVYMNGESAQVKNKATDMISSIMGAISEISSVDELKVKMNNFFIERFAQIEINKGTNREIAIATAQSYLNTLDGKPSDVIGLLKSQAKIGKYNLLGAKKSGFAFKRKNADPALEASLNGGYESGQLEYERKAALIEAYFAFFGIDLPASLLDLNGNQENIQALEKIRTDLIDSGMDYTDADAEVKKREESLPINRYFMTFFTLKEDKEKKPGDYPFAMLASQIVDYVQLQIAKKMKGESFDLTKISELQYLSKIILQVKDSYKSPQFYFNAEFEKEWSMKIKSATDMIVDDLSKNKDGILDEYLKNDLWKSNTFLKSIQQAKGQSIQHTLAGIVSDGEADSKSYDKSGDLDYMYMHLGLFAHANSSETYYHIDDTPSSKPRNYAFRMLRISDSAYTSALQAITDNELLKRKRANARFNEAFEIADRSEMVDGKKVQYFTVYEADNAQGKNDAFQSLVPGVHYEQVFEKDSNGKFVLDELENKIPIIENGKQLYKRGWTFDSKNYFYDGRTGKEALIEIEKETAESFNKLRASNFIFPVAPDFMSELKKKNKSEAEEQVEIWSERRRLFSAWRTNYIINRYHVSQAILGDHLYYKQDGFVDLGKRHTNAPSSKGVFKGDKLSVVFLNDVKTSSRLQKLTEGENNKLKVDTNEENDTQLSGDLTDAQGYITEAAAGEIEEAYGVFGGYAKVYKPVMFGINRKNIADAQPLYLKLSLVKLLDPSNPKNFDYYAQHPEQETFAKKVYASGAKMAIFNTGVKVGVHNLNDSKAESFSVSEFDSRLFGLQNNPFHEVDEDNEIKGGVQQDKQLGDNGNEAVAAIYQQIQGMVTERTRTSFFKYKFSSKEKIAKALSDQLGKTNHSNILSKFIQQGIDILNNPFTSKSGEQLFNSMFKNAMSLSAKSGDKLINTTAFALNRPAINDDDRRNRNEILIKHDAEIAEYNAELQWMGPKKLHELSMYQLQVADKMLSETKWRLDPTTGYILDEKRKIKIFGSEVLVPESPSYQIGDKVIATRIPTSKKANSTPSIVVGFTHPDQGNIIVMSKHGTGIHGFDFDVDGMFVWRSRQSESMKNDNESKMFDVAYSIFTDPKNYNDMISPVSTDNMALLASEIKAISTDPSKFKFSRFSPERQIEIKKAGSSGSTMISISASASGTHSVLAQNGGSEFKSGFGTVRAYAYIDENGQEVKLNSFVTSSRDRNGKNHLISDIYSEFINISTDNDKLLLLEKLNINEVTGNVLFDMISHGVPFDYAIYFINQPIVKEYVQMIEDSSANSTTDSEVNAHDQVMALYQDKIRSIPAKKNYKFYSYNTDGTTRFSKGVERIFIKKDKFVNSKKDRTLLSFKELEEGIKREKPGSLMNSKEEQQFDLLETQMVILDKFKFYKGLASISQDASTLITLTSKYPKSFIGLVEAERKISKVLGESKTGEGEERPLMDIYNIAYSHGVYSEQLHGLRQLIARYSNFKVYAKPEFLAFHEKIAGGKPLDVQEKVKEQTHTYILSQSISSNHNAGIYNFSTSSLHGEGQIDPYFFVNETALVIQALQKELPDNKFLSILEFKKSKATDESIEDRNGEPNFIGTNLLYDPNEALLKEIHDSFDQLDIAKKIDVGGVEYDIKNLQDMILGHLLYSRGFSLGGFNFTKILPVKVFKAMDNTIERIGSVMTENEDSFMELESQILTNIPSLVKEVKADEFKKAFKPENNPGYKKVNVVTRDDGGKNITVELNEGNYDNNKMFKTIAKQAMVNINGVTYRVSPLFVDEQELPSGLLLQESNTKTFKNVQQYSGLWYSKFSNGTLSKKQYQSIKNEKQKEDDSLRATAIPMLVEEVDESRFDSSTVQEPAPSSVPTKFGRPLIDAQVNLDNVVAGIQTGMLTDIAYPVNSGDQVLVPNEDNFVIVRVDTQYNTTDLFNEVVRRNKGDQSLAREKFLTRYNTLEGDTRKKTTAYQGRKGNEDNRKFNYYTTSENEAKDYGVNVISKEISLDRFLTRGTPEANEMDKKYANIGGKRFDILDNSKEGLEAQTKYFEFLEENGYEGYSEITSPTQEDNNYIVTFGNQEAQKIESILGKNLIKFKYEGQVDSKGAVIDSAEGISFYNPIPVSITYEAMRSAGFYKGLTLRVAEKLRSLPSVEWNLTDKKGNYYSESEIDGQKNPFYKELKLNPFEKQILRDHIHNFTKDKNGNILPNATAQTNTHEIANRLIDLVEIPGYLQNYNRYNGWALGEKSPIEQLYEVGYSLFGPNWSAQMDLSNNFDLWAQEVDNEEFINQETGKPFTRFELLSSAYGKFTSDMRRLAEISEAISDLNLNIANIATLREYYREIIQDLGGNRGLALRQPQNELLRDKIGGAIANRAASESIDLIHKRNPEVAGVSFSEVDLTWLSKDITGITDFTEMQPAMQAYARLTSLASIQSGTEKETTKKIMENLMSKVAKYHYAHKPKSFIGKINFWKNVSKNNAIWDWMMEEYKNANGETETRMKLRYAANENKFSDEAFERIKDTVTGLNTSYFVISNKQLLKKFILRNLSFDEQQRFQELVKKYNGFEVDEGTQYDSISEKEKRELSKDTAYFRNLYVKSRVRNEDSVFFAMLKEEAKDTESVDGKLAQAKIDLYDFLYEKNNSLLDEIGKPIEKGLIERGLMPQTKMSDEETIQKYGWKEAYKRFKKIAEDDVDEEIDLGRPLDYNLDQGNGSLQRIPYSTIKKKKDVSINAPKIFAHHFNSLIFKKFHDPIIPVLDSIQQYYVQKRRMGEKFDNIIEFITKYTDSVLLGRTPESSRSPFGKLLKGTTSWTVTLFLGIAPVTSLTNMLVGVTENLKHLIGDNNLFSTVSKDGKTSAGGFSMFMTGLKRMTDKKALMIMNRYQIETFATSDLENAGEVLGGIQDTLLYLQKKTELINRGSMLFAQFSEAQWNAFSVNEDGTLNEDTSKSPSIVLVDEIINDINSIQGKYGKELKRMYSNVLVFQQAALFKGWLIDYVKSRVGGVHYDHYGKQREGYYNTGARLLFGKQKDAASDAQTWNVTRLIDYYKGKDSLTPLEQKNLRKVIFDLTV